MNQPTPDENRWIGPALIALTLLLWGALPVVLKLLLRSLDPFTVTWYRFLFAGGAPNTLYSPPLRPRLALSNTRHDHRTGYSLRTGSLRQLPDLFNGPAPDLTGLSSDRHAILADVCALGRPALF